MTGRRGKSAWPVVAAVYLYDKPFLRLYIKFKGVKRMNEETKKQVKDSETQVIQTEQDNAPKDENLGALLAQLNDLRKNTVSKEEYDKIKEENAALFNAVLNGETIETKQEKKRTVDEIRKDLFNKNTTKTNLDYVKKSLELRNAILEQDNVDIFVNTDRFNQLSPSAIEEEKKGAEAVANVLQHCVDSAKDNPAMFNMAIADVLKDAPRVKNSAATQRTMKFRKQ